MKKNSKNIFKKSSPVFANPPRFVGKAALTRHMQMRASRIPITSNTLIGDKSGDEQ